MDAKYINVMSKANKIQNQALAILNRIKNSNIPPEGWRIKKEKFRPMLDDQYYLNKKQDPNKLANYIYDTPELLFKKKFILIDGGDSSCIKANKAGFAILFRMISCDSNGLYCSGRDLINKLNSGWVSDTQGSRTDITEKLKQQEVLFISGVSPRNFTVGEKAAFEAGTFFDEILEHRYNYQLPTLLSFNHPIISSSRENNIGVDGRCGNYICRLFEADMKEQEKAMKEDFKVLRIRVNKNV